MPDRYSSRAFRPNTHEYTVFVLLSGLSSGDDRDVADSTGFDGVLQPVCTVAQACASVTECVHQSFVIEGIS